MYDVDIIEINEWILHCAVSKCTVGIFHYENTVTVDVLQQRLRGIAFSTSSLAS